MQAERSSLFGHGHELLHSAEDPYGSLYIKVRTHIEDVLTITAFCTPLAVRTNSREVKQSFTSNIFLNVKYP